MARSNATPPFETSAALALLGELVARPGSTATPAASLAWESAWIACLTNCPVWASTAESEFDHVMAELTAALWPRRELTIRLDSSARSEASGTTSFIATTGLGSLYREQMSAASL